MRRKRWRKQKEQMRKLMGTLRWWVITFAAAMFVFSCSLFASAMIPKSAMYNNLLSSAEYYSGFISRMPVIENVEQSKQDFFADAILMNMIACTDSSNPVEASIKGKYYTGDSNISMGQDFFDAVKGVKGNNYYSRYWHGSMIFVRLLLLFTDAQGIHVFNFLLLIALSILFCLMCWQSENKRIAIAFLIGFIVTESFFVPVAIEYMSVYIIALIGGMAALRIKTYKHKVILFTLLGASTAFFDFLTTETIAVLLPLICILVRENSEKKINFKDSFKQSFLLLFIWGASYSLCFLIKWMLSIQIIGHAAKVEIMVMGFDKFGGIIESSLNVPMPLAALFNNVSLLIPTNIADNYSYLATIFAIAAAILMIIYATYYGKTSSYKDTGKILLCIGVLPLIRIMILANHSYEHSYFTYRALITSIMCLVLFYSYLIDTQNLLKSKE
ncbi:MAG: hypothetical protein VB119_00805 [Candidatus Metalachnospira sp.]|nr:hypothetical protein [Candidatus Metalachnospira sp.]